VSNTTKQKDGQHKNMTAQTFSYHTQKHTYLCSSSSSSSESPKIGPPKAGVPLD
jgi:hypothetical protein